MAISFTTDDLTKDPSLKTVKTEPDPILGMGQSIIDGALTDVTETQKAFEKSQKEQADRVARIGDLSGKAGEKAGYKAEQEELAGVNTERANYDRYSQDLNNINANIAGLAKEAGAIPLIVQEEFKNTGATDRGVAPVQTGRLRENAIKALTQSALADITVANINNSVIRYNSAKDKAQRAVDLKFAPIEAEIATLRDQLELNRLYVTEPTEKKLLKQQETILNERSRLIAEAKATETRNVNTRNDFSKIALENGQSDIASQIFGLDPSSPTFDAEVSKLASKLKNPMAILDIELKKAQLAKVRKETSLLGQPSATELKEQREALKNAKASIPIMQNKLTAIDDIKNSAGLKTRVGTSFLSRSTTGSGFFGNLKQGVQNVLKVPLTLGVGSWRSAKNSVTGEGQNFAGSVHQLVSGLGLDELIEAKSRGATFGALSNEELRMLSNSASKINDWEIKDKNDKGTGVWNIDEDSFNKELDRIRDLTSRALYVAEGEVFDPSEKQMLDKVYQSSLDPSGYYSQ